MSLQDLTQLGALAPGSDIWILPFDDAHPWVVSVNWYLNFHYVHSMQREPWLISNRLETIVGACELDLPLIPKTVSKAMLVSSNKHLPNRWTLFLPATGTLEEWLTDGFHRSRALKASSIRYFLPQNKTFQDFSEIWSTVVSTSINEEVSVVSCRK